MKISDKVLEILRELSGVDAIDMESRLQEDLMLDSLHMVMLLIQVEDQFDMVLDESDMNPFDLLTVGQVVELVRRYGENDEK